MATVVILPTTTAAAFIHSLNQLNVALYNANIQAQQLTSTLDHLSLSMNILQSMTRRATIFIYRLAGALAILGSGPIPSPPPLPPPVPPPGQGDPPPQPPDDPEPPPDTRETLAAKGALRIQNAIIQAGKQFGQLIKMSITEALTEDSLKAVLVARAGGERAGEPLYQLVREAAIQNGYNPNDAIKTALELMPTAKDTGQLERMTAMSLEMATLLPGGGDPEAVAGVIKSAMTGDFSGFEDMFNINPDAFEDIDVDKFAKQDDLDGFLDALDDMREKANLGAEALARVGDRPANQITKLQNLLKSGFTEAGMGAVNAISPLLAMLTETLASDKFQVFFTILGNGLTFVAEMLVVVGQGALWLFEQFLTYWPAIAAVLLSIASMFLPAMLTSLWAMIAPLLMQVGAWMLINWPILLIIAAVGILIGVLMHFGTTAGQVIGFVTGIFAGWFAYVNNLIALLWNSWVSFAESFLNLFVDPVYAVKKLFYDLMQGITGFLNSMIKGAIDGINWLIEKINQFTGSSFSAIDQFIINTEAMKEPTSDKNVFDFSKYKMQFKDLGESAKSGAAFGENLVNKAGDVIGNAKEQLNLSSGLRGSEPSKGSGMSPDINRVNEIGSIDEKVDISSEDLKTMRELAEMKNIQNFVSLQPTVSVQTGDINNGYDVDTMINRIERVLSDQIASSAEGVYG
jgi:hypothetical protein